VIIRNAVIIDGSGTAGQIGDVSIADGRIGAIAETGNLQTCPADNIIDANGLALAPGFIDTHSHADSEIFEQPEALAAISQGITTVVVGQDGGSPFPLSGFLSRLESTPTTVNVASYVGHNTLRNEVLGDDSKRAATADEIAAMKALLERELASGALGLSSGLEYEPGIYSDTAEVLALAQATANMDGRYISHIRSEDRWLEDSIDEIIAIGRATGMPVQISHIKLAMTPLWGRAADILAKLNAARAEGVNISADIYPYEYWQSTMMVLLPERDYRDRAAVEEALDTIAPADGIWMTRYEPNPDYVGRTVTEIAALLETTPVDAFMQLAEDADEWQQANNRSAEMIIGTSMNDDDVRTLMAWPHTNICSDGSLSDLHPRGAGSFPRVLGRYARENGALSLESAVQKMSGLAAEHMGFDNRGFIAEGMIADLVLFDPNTVIDRATPENPSALSEGIERVWVAGETVFENGSATENRPGKVIRRNDPDAVATTQ